MKQILIILMLASTCTFGQIRQSFKLDKKSGKITAFIKSNSDKVEAVPSMALEFKKSFSFSSTLTKEMEDPFVKGEKIIEPVCFTASDNRVDIAEDADARLKSREKLEKSFAIWTCSNWKAFVKAFEKRRLKEYVISFRAIHTVDSCKLKLTKSEIEHLIARSKK